MVEMILNLMSMEKVKDCQEEKGECEHLNKGKMVVIIPSYLWLKIVCLLLCSLSLRDSLSS